MHYLLILCFILDFSYVVAQNLNYQDYRSLDSLIQLESEKGNYHQAILYAEKAREKAKAEFENLDSTYAKYTNELGLSYYLDGQYYKAISYWFETKEIYAQIKGKTSQEYADGINDLSVAYQEVGEYKEAEKLLIESIAIKARVLGKESTDYANSLNNLATLYHDLGQYIKAKSLYLEAHAICTKKLDKGNQQYISITNNLAGLYHDIGAFDKAEALFLEVKELRVKVLGEEHPKYAVILHNLACFYEDMGRYSQAKLCYKQARDINAKIFGKEDTRYLLNISGLASLYGKMDDAEQAKNIFLEVKNIRAQINGKNHILYAQALDNIGGMYYYIDSLDKAEVLIKEAMQIKEALLTKNHYSYAISLANLGMLYSKKGQFGKAKALLNEVLKIVEETVGENHPEYAETLNSLAGIYRTNNELDSALIYSIASLNVLAIDSVIDLNKLDELRYKSNENINQFIAGSIEGIFMQYEQTKDTKKLEELYQWNQTTIRLNERFRNEFSIEEDKLRVLKDNVHFIKSGVKAAFFLNETIYKEDAFSLAEQNKSILLLDAIKGNQARIFGDLPDTLVEREIQLQQELNNAQKDVYYSATVTEQAQKTRLLAIISTEIEQFLQSIKNKYPKYHALKYENKVVKVDEIQAALDSETLLIEYLQTNNELFCFVISKDTFELFSIDLSKDILNKRINYFRKSLSDFIFIIENEEKAYEQYVYNAYWLYDKLLSKALRNKKFKKLIIITDGLLGQLPFETFLTQPINSKKSYSVLPYLINDYNISYDYSATLWKENLTKKQVIKTGKLLVCGASYEVLDSSCLNSNRLPYFCTLIDSLLPLPAIKEEVKQLSTSFHGTFVYGKAANELFFKENAPKYDVIHLAMHGVLDSWSPILSSLVFTQNGDSIENNFLQAYEISQLKLNANLVVLSGCETGTGRFQQGEGIMSLARAFMYAGTPALVISLWKVNDNTTGKLMYLFYQNLKKGNSKSMALRQAKLDYIKQAEGIKIHPAFWAAFIQIGNDDAIIIKSVTSFPWLVGLIFLLILIVCYSSIRLVRTYK